MDNTNLKHNRAIMSLNFPIFANEDGSMSTLVKLSMSSRQLDENSEIVVDLKPASEFMPLEEYQTAKGNEKKNSIKSFISGKVFYIDIFSRYNNSIQLNHHFSDIPHPRIGIIENANHKNNENDINNKVLRVSWELEQKNTCIPSCEDECQENLSSTNLEVDIV